MSIARWSSASLAVLFFGALGCTAEPTPGPVSTNAPSEDLAEAPPARSSPVSLAPFLAIEAGHRWEYQNLAPDGLSPIRLANPEAVEADGELWVRREENNGDWRLQRHNAEGVVLRELYFRGGTTVRYAEPALLFPQSLAPGEGHESETAYSVTRRAQDGAPELIEEGLQTYRVELVREHREAVPLGEFDCLELRTVALRRSHGELPEGEAAEKGYDLLECYAEGIGPVRVRGEIFWNGADGERLRTFAVDAALVLHEPPAEVEE